MSYDRNKNQDISTPKQIVDLILNQGASIPCDETTVDSKSIDELPEWFDEQKFKRGQTFFHDNIFGMLFAKLCGLLTVLTIPTTLHILMFTNKSDTPLTAYKRYMATIFHMYLWYNKDFKPGSDLWRSLKDVRSKHFSASKRVSTKCTLNRISQMDMALTQFGFMGFILTKPKMVAIHNATHEDLEGFIHVWKVVGYLMGMDDRFNICRGSVEETKEVCELLIKHHFIHRLKEADDNFKHMSYVLVDGMRVFSPFLNHPACIAYIHDMCDIPKSENPKLADILKLNFYATFIYYFFKFHMYACQFYIFRKYVNYMEYVAFFLITYFPFLAYFKFGFRQSYVQILTKNNE